MVVSTRRIAAIAALIVAMTTPVCSQSADSGPKLRAVLLPQQDDPAPTPQTPSTARSLQPPAPPEGCVLLQNNHVLFGHAHQLGEFVIVRSSQGGEIRLSRKQVACWANSLRDLYQYRVDHRRDGDVTAHLQDAKWCLRHDLLDLAAGELRAVYALDPDNADAKRIEQQLSGRAAGGSSPAERAQAVVPVDFESDEVKSNEVESDDFESTPPSNSSPKTAIDGETLRLFAGHVQPMLINRCANCHSNRLAEHTNVQWRITAPPRGARPSAEITRSNLEATIGYIDSLDPANSPLLIQATTEHGGHGAPLTQRNAKAINGLQAWVEFAARAINGEGTMNFERRVYDDDPLAEANRNVAEEVVESPTAETEVQAPATAISGPARLPQVENPFDPDLFNRRFHMKTNGQP